jgi:ABC-2 type transport system ATP-binding protein
VDPAGVVLFRRLLADLKGRGVTVLLNSHQLDQVERVCDRVAYVSRGRVEAIETVSAGAAHSRAVRVRWTAGAPFGESAFAGAAAAAGAQMLSHGEREARFVVADDAGAAKLVESLVRGGVPVFEVAPDESRLERLFLEPPAGGAP